MNPAAEHHSVGAEVGLAEDGGRHQQAADKLIAGLAHLCQDCKRFLVQLVFDFSFRFDCRSGLALIDQIKQKGRVFKTVGFSVFGLSICSHVFPVRPYYYTVFIDRCLLNRRYRRATPVAYSVLTKTDDAASNRIVCGVVTKHDNFLAASPNNQETAIFPLANVLGGTGWSYPLDIQSNFDRGRPEQSLSLGACNQSQSPGTTIVQGAAAHDYPQGGAL